MISTAPRLVSVGNVLVDITAHVAAVPGPGEDVQATESQLTAGGCFNVLAAAVRQGLPGAYAGASGTGPFGDLARSALRDTGVEVLLPPVRDLDTGYDIALVEADGERRFVTAFGAEARLTLEQLAGLSLRQHDVVHVSGYGLLPDTNGDTLATWLLGLRTEHLVLFDPGPLVADIAPGTLRVVRERAGWISANEREAALLSGRTDPHEAAESLAADGSGVVVRLGAAGCLVTSDATVVEVPGFPSRVVDTNGAGDAHVGAFLAALAAGRSPVAAARRANACAAISVSRRGPATAPTAAEVDALLTG